MNSSISSSRTRSEWKVLAVVAVTACIGEAGTHFLERYSADYQHRSEIPEISSDLRDSDSTRVLFLGNSLTRWGVRLESFEEQLGRHDIRLGGVCRIYPDATTLRQWHYLYQSQFARPSFRGTAPDIVIISVVHDHLTDQVGIRPRRLAMVIDGVSQLVDVLCHDVHSVDEGAAVLSAYAFKSVEYQPNVMHRALECFVPHYRSQTQQLNRRRQKSIWQQSSNVNPNAAGGSNLSYTYLREFIELLKKNGSHGIFCMMPLPEPQEVDMKMVKTIESSGMTFLDLRGLKAKTRGHYPDGYHMDSVAADLYSRALADAVAVRLPVALD